MLTTGLQYGTVPDHCRRAIVPACEQHTTQGGNPPAVDGKIMTVKKGDVIDIGVDWSQFFAANEVEASGVTSLFAAHGSSPKAPTFEGVLTLYDKGKAQSVVLLDLTGAVVQDMYWINCTVEMPGVATGDLTLPTRTVTRTIHVRVVQ